LATTSALPGVMTAVMTSSMVEAPRWPSKFTARLCRFGLVSRNAGKPPSRPHRVEEGERDRHQVGGVPCCTDVH
jgi:hypothetical protein